LALEAILEASLAADVALAAILAADLETDLIERRARLRRVAIYIYTLQKKFFLIAKFNFN
jgi:hypothetical protein